MKYYSILGRSFTKSDQRKLGCGAFLGFLMIAFTLCTVFKPYLKPLPIMNLQMSSRFRNKMQTTEERNASHQIDANIRPEKADLICNTAGLRSDFCEVTGDIRIQGNSSTVFLSVTNQTTIIQANTSYTIKPFARKEDKTAMSKVNSFTVNTSVVSQGQVPECTKRHSAVGIVFSNGGHSGNLFHDFTDVVIPLYLTSQEFNGEVQFLTTNTQTWWHKKYATILKKLSKYEIIDLVIENGVYCFPKVVVDLKKHKELSIDPSSSPYSMKEFTKFLREAFGLKRETAIQLKEGDERKPRLLIVSRKRTRSFMNAGEIVKLAKELGFEVIVTEADSNLERFSRLVNSCDVMMGVHGAGLTNSVFLPENAVFIQIVPLGRFEWVSRISFGEPAKAMNLQYMEYKIGVDESSLIQEYPRDHQILKDPYSIQKTGWNSLGSQRPVFHMERFKESLVEAKRLLIGESTD